ncbi:hypothetical protein E1281_02255 [Actinomadura sp. KC345]|uniref:hypothetical protein n=1 Tax=Actinomadura sp. KC345 TaxID=2530371 RepID=UPI00104B3764|nr:hypothetical protein [Actinomadura sp. KC345]TDC58183.1 hypothetical protein E1281_02255 [Actinomadura sp. KC345]
MTDWTQLRHAYGRADDVPGMLDRLVPDDGAEVWTELSSAICHQGTVYSASFAALPRLTEFAREWAPADRLWPLSLSGSIVAGADQDHGLGDVRAEHAAEITELLRLAEVTLEAVGGEVGEYSFLDLLQSILAFEDVPVWSERLTALASGEFELYCEDCDECMHVILDEPSFYVYVSGVEATSAVVPAAPDDLEPLARRLYLAAEAAGRSKIMNQLLHLFGTTACPECGRGFQTAAEVADGRFC